MFSVSTHYKGKEILIPDRLFKGTIQIQMNPWSKNLHQSMFKLNTLKTTEITNTFTAMYHDRHLTSKMWAQFPELLF